jgi:hypothetical protein
LVVKPEQLRSARRSNSSPHHVRIELDASVRRFSAE